MQAASSFVQALDQSPEFFTCRTKRIVQGWGFRGGGGDSGWGGWGRVGWIDGAEKQSYYLTQTHDDNIYLGGRSISSLIYDNGIAFQHMSLSSVKAGVNFNTNIRS